MIRNRTIVIGMILALVSVLILTTAYLLAQPVTLSFSLYLEGHFNGANATGDFGGAKAIAQMTPNIKIPEVNLSAIIANKQIKLGNVMEQEIQTPDIDVNSTIGSAEAQMNFGQANTNIRIDGEITVPAYSLVIAYLYYSHFKPPEIDIGSFNIQRFVILLGFIILAAMIIILGKRPEQKHEKYILKEEK